MIIDDVTIGEIPNSMSVPLFDARMTLTRYSGSVLELTNVPYNGI